MQLALYVGPCHKRWDVFIARNRCFRMARRLPWIGATVGTVSVKMCPLEDPIPGGPAGDLSPPSARGAAPMHRLLPHPRGGHSLYLACMHCSHGLTGRPRIHTALLALLSLCSPREISVPGPLRRATCFPTLGAGVATLTASLASGPWTCVDSAAETMVSTDV